MLVGKMYYKKVIIDFHFFYSELSQQTFVGLQDMSWRCLQLVFSITVFFCLLIRHLARRLEDLQDVFKTSWKIKILCWKSLEDITWRRLQGMSWRRLEYMSWKCLQDTLKTNKMFSGERPESLLKIYVWEISQFLEVEYRLQMGYSK